MASRRVDAPGAGDAPGADDVRRAYGLPGADDARVVRRRRLVAALDRRAVVVRTVVVWSPRARIAAWSLRTRRRR